MAGIAYAHRRRNVHRLLLRGGIIQALAGRLVAFLFGARLRIGLVIYILVYFRIRLACIGSFRKGDMKYLEDVFRQGQHAGCLTHA